jgi:hypothetical protein
VVGAVVGAVAAELAVGPLSASSPLVPAAGAAGGSLLAELLGRVGVVWWLLLRTYGGRGDSRVHRLPVGPAEPR